MAAGRFEFESMVFGSVLASAFDKNFKAANPFDRREVLPMTAEEKAELAAAQERIEALKRQVFQQAQERHGTQQ